MKWIKIYKIFESVDIEDEVKECFLPVIDIIYDKFILHKFSDSCVSIFIEFIQKDNDILVEEILDAILHCSGYNLKISEAAIMKQARLYFQHHE